MSDITLAMVRKAMIEDLSESGITTKTQISKLKVSPLTPERCEEITDQRIPGYEIPYFDPRGRPLKRFSRVKFLAKVPGNPGQKYWQQPETLPHAYLSPLLKRGQSWAKILSDPEIPLLITEGEKKAACACLNGLPTVGLGGVWSFKSSKAGQHLIEELKAVKWKGRKVFVVFDNDVMVKPEVLRALQTLTSTLRERGVTSVEHLYLEGEDEEEKLGLDDFIVQYGVDALESMPSSQDELLDRLHEMNSRYAIVESQGERPFSTVSKKFLSLNGFTQVAEAPNRIEIVDANNKPKMTSVAKEWVKWPNRRTYRDVVFEPGQEQRTDDNGYNLWEGYPYRGKKGDVDLFLELVDHVFRNATEDEKNWFLRWAACPLQKPGTKLHSSVLVWGDQGSGKTFLGLLLRNLYGHYGRQIQQGTLLNDFNEWAVHAQFVVADEAIFHGNRRESSALKNIVTQEFMTVNVKYQPTYTLRDYVNYYFTSNYHDAIYMEKDDRRFLVVNSTGKKPQKFYTALERASERPEFNEALMYYMLNVDLRSFGSKTAPPFTESKQDMIWDTMSSLDQVIAYAVENPHEFFVVGGEVIGRSSYTAEEIFHLLPNHVSKNTTVNAVGHALRRVGCRKLKLNVVSGNRKTTKRVYVIDQKASMTDLVEEQSNNVTSITEPRKRRKKFREPKK